MKASLRFLFIVLLLSVCLATKIKTKAKGKSKNKRRSPVDAASPDPAAANAEPPAPIKLDTTGLFIPSNPPTLAKKPQLVIQRQGKANPSEAYHEQLQANEQCKLRQGYVLMQTSLNTKCFFLLSIQPLFQF